MISPTVSVIVPNYNHAKYLPERLGSIYNQVYQDIEVILLDDCSQDGSVNILRKYQKNRKTRSLSINQENSGSTFCQWQRGVALARGYYLWFAESDDVASVDFLQHLVDKCRQDQDIVLAYCQSDEIDGDGRIIGDYYRTTSSFLDADLWDDDFAMEGPTFVRRYLTQRNVIPNASAVLIKRSALTGMPWRYLGTFRYAGDWLLYCMLLQKGKIAFVNKKLNRFRSHSASTRINKGVEGWKSYFSEQFLVLHYLQQHACCDCADEFQKCVEALHAYITLNCRLKGFFKTCNCTEIVIYGAGGIGRHICNLLQDSFGHIRVIGFIDRMATQHPKLQVNGIPVMTLQGFINMKKDIPICIGSIIYAEEIEALLMGNGLGEKILKIVEIDKIR